ncbi:MAG: LysM peptidoglycan-binding domain-containing protein [Chloroflexota bacterium]
MAVIVLGLGMVACGSTATTSPSAEPSTTETPSIRPTVEATATATPEPSPEPSLEMTIYVVRKGDTLVAIAARYNVTLDALRAANPEVTDPRKLQIGTKLNIPSP